MLPAFISALLKNWRISRAVKRSNIAVLYHAVDRETYDKAKHQHTHYVALANVLKQLRSIQKNKTFVSAEEFLFETKKGVTRASLACLTFDDGYQNTWQTLIPQLEELQIPSVFFVNSSMVMGRPFWRDQVRYIVETGLQIDFIQYADLERVVRPDFFYTDTKDPQRCNSTELRHALTSYLSSKKIPFTSPMTFCTITDLKMVTSYKYVQLGNHTSNHPVLSTLTKSEQHSEILEGKEFLETNFPASKISKIFSMPFGGRETYNLQTIEILEMLQYAGVFASGLPVPSKNASMQMGISALPVCERFLPKHYLTIYQW